MVVYTRHLKQTVTYWAITSVNEYGKPTFAAPVTLAARWESKLEMVRNRLGDEIVSSSRVYIEQPVAIDGYLYLGTSMETDPTTLSGAWKIIMIGQQPDLRNLHQLNVAYL